MRPFPVAFVSALLALSACGKPTVGGLPPCASPTTTPARQSFVTVPGKLVIVRLPYKGVTAYTWNLLESPPPTLLRRVMEPTLYLDDGAGSCVHGSQQMAFLALATGETTLRLGQVPAGHKGDGDVVDPRSYPVSIR